MIRAISFRPVQAFKAGDSPSLKTGNSKIQFAGNDEVSLTKSRGLTEKELKIVDDYVNLLAQLFLKNNDGEVKKFEKDNDIRGLGANPATTRAYSKAKKEKIKEIEKKGLLPEEKQKIDGIADKYVE